MRRREFLRTAQVAGVLASGATAGCSGERVTPTPPQNGDVTMTLGEGNYYFDPVGLHVEPGETVTWVTWKGLHSTVAFPPGEGIPEDASSWNSGVVQEPGEAFEHTFETEGTFDYFCDQHKNSEMVGRIVVGEPGDSPPGTATPLGDVPAVARIVEEGSVPYDEFDA